jgi:endonuclease/exonuclease/phosphatase family metal-dependent hydrolase
LRKLLKFIALSLNLLVVLALLTSYISGYISPEKWWIPSFFGLAYPVILGINLFFMVFWLILSPRYVLVSLLTVLVGWGVLSRYVQIQGKSVDRGDIKILSFNVHHFRGNGELSSTETAAEITRFIKDQRPDIVCLQEARLRQNTIFNLAKTVEELEFINHYQFARTSSTFGSVTLTRYPIVNMDEIRFENSRNITIYTDILIGTDTVRVFNVHLHSYGIDPKNYSIIDSGVTTEEDLKEAREMGSKLKRGFEMRARQVETIRKIMDKTPYPIIVCGDLNETPTSFAYQQLRDGLKDAFVGSGKGIGRTFVNKLPALRIDYIFHSPVFESYNFITHEFRHSDHLPVSTELVRIRD